MYLRKKSKKVLYGSIVFALLNGSIPVAFAASANHAPTLVKQITNQTATLGQNRVIDLSPIFFDADGDTLKFTAISMNIGVASVAVSGSQLTLKPLSPGTSKIQVSVDDGKTGRTTTNFNVTVSANHAPTVEGIIVDKTTTVGASLDSIDLSYLFTDDDGDTLTFSATSSDPQTETADISGHFLTFAPLAIGTSTINVTADDGLGGTASTSFMVIVNPAAEPPVNHAPTVPLIMGLTTTVGANIPVIDLSYLFTDIDRDPLTFSAASSDTQAVTAEVSGNLLTLTPLAKGLSSINVSADDGHGGNTSTSFSVLVNPANHAPTVANPVSDQTTTLGANIPSIDLYHVFTDIDEYDSLTFSADSSDPQTVTADALGLSLILTPLAVGTSTINVTADDGHGGSVSTSFSVTVNPANHAPTVANLVSNQITTVGANIPAIDLSTVFTDIDSDTLTFSADSSDSQKITVDISGHSLSLTPLAVGTSTINVTANDGHGGTVSTSFIVTVSPANHAPTVANLVSDQITTVGASIPAIDLSTVFTDIDSDTLTFSADSSDSQKITADISGHSLSLAPLAEGSSTISVTADDGHGGSVSTSFVVTVNPNQGTSNNHAPTVDSTIYEQVLTPGVTNLRTYDLSQLFSDEDGDTLQFTATAADSNLAAVSVDGSSLTLSPGNEAGSTTVTVTADDGNGGVKTYTFTVRTAPLVSGGMVTIHTKNGVKDPLSYDLSTLFPGQTSFTTYMGTADSTFTGPDTLTGTSLPLTTAPLYTWVIGSDGNAAVIQVVSDPQGPQSLYFSQYLDGGNGRIALQMYYDGTLNQPDSGTGYELDVYKWMKKTNTMAVEPYPIQLVDPNGPYWINPYIVIDSIFYDFFDISNASYYNIDTMLYDPTNYNVVAYVLKKNGQIVDVLGDPTSHNQFMPNGGTIIRKSGIWSGSQTYSEAGEWNKIPMTYALIGQHTP